MLLCPVRGPALEWDPADQGWRSRCHSSDLSLPDSQGFDTYRKLQVHSKGLPVILLTGLEDEELGTESRHVRARRTTS